MDFDIQDMEGYWDLVGCEVPDGWKKLYNPIVEYIRCNNEKCSKEERIRILQIKEWAGQLSIFVDGGGEELQDMIFQAEQRSKTTCQVRGAEGKEHIKGNHYFVACEKCFLITNTRLIKKKYIPLQKHITSSINVKYKML